MQEIAGPVEYDPEKHQGLLNFGGLDIIIADASQARLHEMPLGYRKALAESTKAQLALIDFSRGVGGVIIKIVDEKKTQEREGGYRKGIELLRLTGYDDIDARFTG